MLNLIYDMVESSLKAWQALTKAQEKEKEMMEMVILIVDIGSLSEAWRELTELAAQIQEAAYGRVKREFGSLEIVVSWLWSE